MVWITEHDEPELLKGTVDGKPGFLLMPNGEDANEIVFESHEALFIWTQRFMEKVQHAQHAQTYEDWLETKYQ